MKKDFIPFLVRLLIYSVLIYVVFLLVRTDLPEKFYYEHTEWLIVFFFLVTAFFHYGMLNRSEKGGRNVITYFMMATAAKFFLYLIMMIVYALMNPGKATAFISSFFAIYVLLTVFEASVIYRLFKNKTFGKTGNQS